MTYDEKLFFLIKNLEELKILRRNESSKIYKTYLDKLNLLNDEVDNFHPNDSSYENYFLKRQIINLILIYFD